MKKIGNLILTIKNKEMIKIGDEIFITLLGKRQVAIECPKEIKITKILKEDFQNDFQINYLTTHGGMK